MTEWKKVFECARVIPPHSQTVRQAQGPSQGFQLAFRQLEGLQVRQQLSDESNAAKYQLRVTLFDTNHHQFFGRTWRSLPHETKFNQGQPNRILFNEVVYFHTSLKLSSVVAVVELVLLSHKADGTQNATGAGFGILHLFSSKMEAQGSKGECRLSLFHGTPRALLHPSLRGPLELNRSLTVMEGAQLLYTLQPHPPLNPIMHLLPQNILVSGHDRIPGVVPATGAAADSLRKPGLLRSLPCVLERLSVCLRPSLEGFESDLLQLLHTDCQNTNWGLEGSSVVVQERRLHVGVHNGWGFVERPQVMVLEPESEGTRGRSGSLRQTSVGRLSSSSSHVLALRNNVALHVVKEPAFGLVFQLEYVFSAPLSGEGKMSSTATSRTAFMQCLGWGVWTPFQDTDSTSREDVCLSLQTGALPNPWSLMVYSTPKQSQSSEQTNAESGIIKFRFLCSGERNPSSPAQRHRSEEILKPKKSFSTGQEESNHELVASKGVESLRGPGLSISQLAATSRYPTMSHSMGSPWQQELPSRLAPSSLASAHQLSHVERPAANSIAHLEVSVRESQGPGTDAGSSLEESELHELPFTPVHAPVIALGTQVAGSTSVSSRGSLAHLFSARFPEILDCNNQVAEVLDPTEPVNFNPQREEADPLQSNTLIFQFLAFTRVPQAGVGPDWPRSVHFAFQLYRFPPVTTQRLMLLDADKAKPKSADNYPCVLALINKDGTVNSGSHGLQLQYCVDAGFLKPGERPWLLRYLALHTLQLDVWDSDSLLLIGSAALELKHMLRQGRPAVQATYELEVITTDYHQDSCLGNKPSNRQRAEPPINVFTTVRGRLHLRLGNVGHPAQRSLGFPIELPPSRSCVIQACDGTQGFGGGSVSANNIHNLHVRKAGRARRLVEIDGQLANLLHSRKGVGERTEGPQQGETEEIRQRKLNRMAAVRQREEQGRPSDGPKPSIMLGRESRAQHLRDLKLIEAYRERAKVEDITNMLCQAITTQHTVYASLGTAEFFEFVLKNPFNVQQTVTIECSDPELSVIVDSEEWKYFKELTKTLTPLEEDMFHLKENTLTPQVYLRPKESVHIPLKYQTFHCDHSLPSQSWSSLKSARNPQMAQKNQSSTLLTKSVKVTFKAEDGKPLAICQVNVEPTPPVIDQTFRFFHPELTFLKKAIRLPPWERPAGVADGSVPVSVRCSDPNVICDIMALALGEPQDVFFKVAGSPSPQIRKFFITVFTDRWLAVPAQTWEVYVHYLQRVDVNCASGQLSWHSLVLRGTQAVRKVKCYSSHPLEIQIDPSEVFVLPPEGVQDLQVGLRPLRSGSRFVYLNVVDVENCQLVASWLLAVTCRQPIVTKTYQISVPVGEGRGTNKKITYTNPYPNRRVFQLRSDHPDLLQFKEDHFQVGGGEIYSIGLRFAPSQSPGTEEILIYMNNQEDKNEETFCVKVQYQ
ncbi:nephrocystin-4 [Chanos chanos]|uniref:Nephrocystin-4 n=1 Tax=Chanos chanos TaxID=29144 RepID=A0A6J2WCN2_CHACN|nr:nephrocystin-4 [Chanos chanos]